MTIFRKKNTNLDKTEMKRHFKVIDLIFLGLGSMVGTGILQLLVLVQLSMRVLL